VDGLDCQLMSKRASFASVSFDNYNNQMPIEEVEQTAEEERTDRVDTEKKILIGRQRKDA